MPVGFYIAIAVLAVIALIGITIFCIKNLLKKKYKNFVLQNSTCLKQLRKINRNYGFYPHISFDQYHTYDNEKLYNEISCKDYLIYQLQFIQKRVFDQIEKISSNKQQYSKYTAEVQSIKDTESGKFQAPIGKLRLNKLIEIEQLLIEKNTCRAPVTQFSFRVTLNCSTMSGRVYDGKSAVFVADDVYILAKKLNNKRGDFYIDREIWDALCRVERGKVSNKMRFSIYQRDGHRCCKCGISEKYAQLEIDHIMPISRGGKTTYDNLQTLCHKCNVEKGNAHIKY